MPWRGEKDPYKIWISEVMLQQTQVKTVIPYYKEFVKVFPNIKLLANAKRDSLMKLWEGLGYYRRAKHLQETAKFILDNGQNFPKTKNELLKLKGIGDYTASMISSVAFGEKQVAIDGNVLRVASRYFLIKEDIELSHTRTLIKQLLFKRLPRFNVGLFNEALMELGSLICTKKNPNCKICPLKNFCKAYKFNMTMVLPFRKKKAKIKHYDVSVGVVLYMGEVLIGLRKPNQLLGHLWEFPGGKVKLNESKLLACKREIKEETNLIVEPLIPLSPIKHSYTHFKITLHPFICKVEDTEKNKIENKSSEELRWVKICDLKQYAFPVANHPIIDFLQHNEDKWKIGF